MKEFIYILINPALPGLVKIGRTDRSPEDRAKELSSTGLPASFMVAYEHEVSNSRDAEAAIHEFLSEQGVRPNSSREFFNIPLKLAVSVVSNICERYQNFTDDVLEDSFDSIDIEQSASDFYWKGFAAFHGDDSEFQDYAKALDYLSLSYKLGYLDAADMLSDIYLWGLTGRQQPEKALNLLHEAAKAGAPTLYLKLARIYFGTEANESREKKTEWLVNFDNAVKCYAQFFASEVDGENRLHGLSMLFSEYKVVFGSVYPIDKSWPFLDAEIQRLSSKVREILVASDNNRAGVSAGEFITVIDILQNGVNLNHLRPYMKNIFDGYGVGVIRRLLKNLPDERVCTYISKYSEFLHDAPKQSSRDKGFLSSFVKGFSDGFSR